MDAYDFQRDAAEVDDAKIIFLLLFLIINDRFAFTYHYAYY